MSDSNASGGNKGVGFMSLLALLFIALKLTGYIKWSWWLVTLPIWGGVAFILLVIVLLLLWKAYQVHKMRKENFL
jgi:hypothetical protein